MTDAEIVARIMDNLYESPTEVQHYVQCPAFDDEHSPCQCEEIREWFRGGCQ